MGRRPMHGWDTRTESLFGYVSCEARVPLDHPLRPIRHKNCRYLFRTGTDGFEAPAKIGLKPACSPDGRHARSSNRIHPRIRSGVFYVGGGSPIIGLPGGGFRLLSPGGGSGAWIQFNIASLTADQSARG
jgi:hypothetical protein